MPQLITLINISKKNLSFKKYEITVSVTKYEYNIKLILKDIRLDT